MPTETRILPAAGTEFGTEAINEVIGEVQPLLQKHWAEIAHHKDIELEVDWDQYRTMEDADMLRVFTARRGPNRALVGLQRVLPGEQSPLQGVLSGEAGRSIHRPRESRLRSQVHRVV